MARPSPDVLAHEGIRAGTYPALASSAITLYDSIQFAAAHVGEPVDFAGKQGLDVGSYDGPYRQVIGALELKRVVSIEPNCTSLHRGIAAGVIPKEDAYNGTLQQWVADGHDPAHGVFVFNMAPSLPNRPDFLRALSAATALGGLMVATFREAAESLQFVTAVRATPALGFRQLNNHRTSGRGVLAPDMARNRFLHLWRREA